METRNVLKKELKNLEKNLLEMGRIVEEMLHGCTEALAKRDARLAAEVIDKDDEVDDLNWSIEEKCLELIALQQPMASDLRTIAAAMKIITDVERCGDYAVDIAKTARQLSEGERVAVIGEIPQMARIVMDMMRQSLEGFVGRDVEKIQTMIDEDDVVDRMYKELHEKIADEVLRRPELVRSAFHALLIIRYLERIADHITNVGERVYYMVTGELKELHQ